MATGSSSWALWGYLVVVVIANLLAFYMTRPSEQNSNSPSTHAESANSASATAGEQGPTSADAGNTMLRYLGLESIQVLRLPRAADRCQGLIQGAEQLGVPLQFINSSDGIWDERFRSRVMPSLDPESTCADVIGAIFDTHERAWRLAANATEPTLILEDDVLLPDEFPELFHSRFKALPEGWHMAFAGCSVTRNAARISAELSRPDAEDVNKQALLGFWAYVVSPAGAKRLLQLTKRERSGDRRLFQPVDLFVAHRLRQLKVFTFEPSAALAVEFEQRPDRHHVLSTMRQVGIVTLAQYPTTNRGLADEEAAEVEKHSAKGREYGEKGDFVKALRESVRAVRKMRHFGCWASYNTLANVGLSLLRLLGRNAEGAKPVEPRDGMSKANRTLVLALEALASSIRYTQGTWLERQKREEYPKWVRYELQQRQAAGLPVVEPPGGWGSQIDVPGGGWLKTGLEDLTLNEPVGHIRDVAKDGSPHEA
mmetsp:Transcript_51643/g.122915  ORF Transcript_51643/g.122915 Transcript_51643/m.122915 type:complete len:483 (+) Transcript_51643:130-1578(+)